MALPESIADRFSVLLRPRPDFERRRKLSHLETNTRRFERWKAIPTHLLILALAVRFRASEQRREIHYSSFFIATWIGFGQSGSGSLAASMPVLRLRSIVPLPIQLATTCQIQCGHGTELRAAAVRQPRL